MKIIQLNFFFVLLLGIFLSTTGFAQDVLDKKISLQTNDQDITMVLKQIEKKAKVRFAYSPENLGNEKYDFNYEGQTLSEILKEVFKKNNISYKVKGNSIILYKNDLKKDIPIKGKVIDALGNPLNGVSVTVKNGSGGTSTDINGDFSLTVPDGNVVLVFSYVGYSTHEVALKGKNVINVILSPSTAAMDEVVVVGYGTQKKSVVTGAISSVKASDLENQQIGRLEQALQGRASGLTIASSSGAPGSAATVRVRGTTSLNAGANEPLYVVDGIVVTSGGIDFLNPADIESIEVLKDAASAAIYGARSAAGVILVTTKKGKQGGLKVTYNGYYGVQAPAKKLDLLDATQYATFRNEQSLNDGGAAVFTNPESFGKGTNWQDLIFNNSAKVQNHEVSLSGGGDKYTFYSSFGFYGQDGIVAPEISNFKRYNFRLNSSYNVTPWLTFGETLGYSHIDTKGNVAGNTDFGGPLSSAIMLDPITNAIITDTAESNRVPYSTQPVLRDENGNPYGISNYVAQQVTNPLAYIKINDGNNNWSDDFVGNVYLEAEPIKGLKLRSTLGATLGYGGAENFSPIFYLNSNQLSTNTSFRRNEQKSLNYNLENTLSFTRSINRHDFNILLGQGAYLDNNSTGLNVTYFNIPVSTFREASLNYSVSATDVSAGGYEGIHHTVSSLFSRLTYSYDSKYLFTGIIRRDGSSRFGANNKFGYFPSASIGWVASRENFWTFSNIANFFKVRGSYGITGNDVLGNFRYLATVGGGRNYSFGYDNYLIGYSPDAPANPDLKWEQTSQLNFGFDAVLFQNWSVTFDWYKKKTSGILQTIDYPVYVGATGSSYGNVADMENRGIELELGYHKRIGEVKFNIRGNVSNLKNNVTYLGENKAFLEGGANLQNSTYALTRTAVGHSIGAFFGFQTEGIFQNQKEIDEYIGPGGTPIQPKAVPGDFKWADTNGDGAITNEDRTFIGDPLPNWSYGLTINASWKNFDFVVFGQGVAGNQIFQGLRRLDIPTANWQTDVYDRWHGEGTSNSYPRLTIKDANKNYANPSDFHLQNGDYFRIKTLQVGYTLPNSLLDRAKLKTVRVYVSSNNLVTFTKYTGFDPEIGGSSYGIDRAIYPQSRSFLLGVNFGF